MWRDWLWRIAQLLLSLLGALAFASALATLSHPVHGVWGFLSAFSDDFSQAVRGHFGSSMVTAHAVADVVAQAWPATVRLALAGGAIAFVLGVPLGILLSASRLSRAAAPFIEIAAATPIFCAALLLIALDVHFANGAFAAVLPAFVVGTAGAACVQLALRRTAAIAAAEPYRAGLRLMGLGAWDIDLRYVLPQIIAGIAENLGEIVLTLLAATAIVELVFGIDGAAPLFFKSAAAHDWNVAALVLLLFATTKLVADFMGLVISRLLVAHP